FPMSPAIENDSRVMNSSRDHHGISGYLGAPQVAARIVEAHCGARRTTRVAAHKDFASSSDHPVRPRCPSHNAAPSPPTSRPGTPTWVGSQALLARLSRHLLVAAFPRLIVIYANHDHFVWQRPL